MNKIDHEAAISIKNKLIWVKLKHNKFINQLIFQVN